MLININVSDISAVPSIYDPDKAQTRVGNWNEDVYLADEIAADFERLKTSGALKHQRTARIKEELYSEVATSPHGDKGVCLGDIVMVKNLSLSTSVSLFSDNQKDYIVTGKGLVLLHYDEVVFSSS